MIQDKLKSGMEMFDSFDLLQQAVISFWSLCVVGFYGIIIYAIYLIIKASICRLKGTRI